MRAQKMEICSGLPLLSMRLRLVFILIFMLLIFSKWYAVNAYCMYHQKKKELVLKKKTQQQRKVARLRPCPTRLSTVGSRAVGVLTGTWTLSLQLGGKLGISENKRLAGVTTPEAIEDLELTILRNQELGNILFNF